MRQWLSAAGPIAILVTMIAIGGFALLTTIAHEQDETFRRSTVKLVERAVDAKAATMKAMAPDYAFWEPAYDATQGALDESWLADNMYATSADGVVIWSNAGETRYVWTSDDYADSADVLVSDILRATPDADVLGRLAKMTDGVSAVATFNFTHNGQLVVAAISPLRPVDPDRLAAAIKDPRVNYLLIVDVIDETDVAAMGGLVGVDELTFAPAVRSERRPGRVTAEIEAGDGALVGALHWRDSAPGTAAFNGRFGLLVVALLVMTAGAVLVALRLGSLQVRTHEQSRRVAEQARRVSDIARQAAEEASVAKSQFLANMSHELRTPLNAIIGYSEMIEEKAFDEQRKEDAQDVERIHKSARHLLGLINEILDHAKMESGAIDLAYAPCDIATLVRDAAELIRPQAEAAGNRLEVACAPDIGMALVDEKRLKQCLLNLAGNAVKFTQRGVISIAAHAELRADGVRTLVFAVTDTGIGIDPDALRRLFTPFVQADGSITRRFGGTGLGLSITRRLVEAMKGEVDVQSERGAGSRFTLTIPLGAVPDLRAAA